MKSAMLKLPPLLLFTILTACASPEDVRPAPEPEKTAELEAAPEQLPGGAVRETMDAAGYTYVRVEADGRSCWAAGPQTPVAIDDKVVLPAGMLMKDFRSRKLGRTFEWLWLVGSIEVEGAAAAQPNVAAMHAKPAAVAPAFDFSRIKKPNGGLTVAEIHAQKSALAGKTVTIRAIAVKVTPQVMGRTWIHLRDGTGAPGTNDLTVTSDAIAEAGDVVLVTGTVVVSKDFGFGYKYEVLLENGKLKVE